ncbi:unnamed protein product [Penicillium discolor]
MQDKTLSSLFVPPLIERTTTIQSLSKSTIFSRAFPVDLVQQTESGRPSRSATTMRSQFYRAQGLLRKYEECCAMVPKLGQRIGRARSMLDLLNNVPVVCSGNSSVIADKDIQLILRIILPLRAVDWLSGGWRVSLAILGSRRAGPSPLASYSEITRKGAIKAPNSRKESSAAKIHSSSSHFNPCLWVVYSGTMSYTPGLGIPFGKFFNYQECYGLAPEIGRRNSRSRNMLDLLVNTSRSNNRKHTLISDNDIRLPPVVWFNLYDRLGLEVPFGRSTVGSDSAVPGRRLTFGWLESIPVDFDNEATEGVLPA